MEKKTVFTREDYNKLSEELNRLKTEGRDDIAEKIKEARSHGDLSENAEYDEAMNEQAKLEAEIAKLEADLRNAKILDETELTTEFVRIGSKVKLYDMDFEEEVEYKIQIFKLLNSRKKFISAIVKASFSALKELGFEVSKTHGTKELIYDIINTIISDLLLTKQNLEEGLNAEELFDFEKSAHIKSLSRSLIKETFCLKYDDCNGTLLCKNFQPELIYTDENGNKNIITTFSDLF